MRVSSLQISFAAIKSTRRYPHQGSSALGETTKRNLLIQLGTLIVSFVALISVEAGRWTIVMVPLPYVVCTSSAAYQIPRKRKGLNCAFNAAEANSRYTMSGNAILPAIGRMLGRAGVCSIRGQGPQTIPVPFPKLGPFLMER